MKLDEDDLIHMLQTCFRGKTQKMVLTAVDVKSIRANGMNM